MGETIAVPGLPGPLSWALPPAHWSLDGAALTIGAGPATDLFISPAGDPPTLNAPRLLAPVEGDFLLSARVTVDFASTFDAGVLLLWHASDRWAKLCFELSPQGQPMVVSVVTRGVSDDANAYPIAGRAVYLRVARLGPACAFHASADGASWDLIRHFALDGADPLLAGFEVQSPTGPGCTATFADVRFTPGRLSDIRSGA